MPVKKCVGSFKADARNIADLTDADLLKGLSHHEDPKWWKEDYVVVSNQAYLRRWGSLLRREARRRELL